LGAEALELGVKIIAAYHRIEPYTEHHIALAAEGFDWIEALRMLRRSAQLRAGVETFVITDQDLPVPHYRYSTTESYLMLWILEVTLKYLESDDFDQNTVFLGADELVLKPLNFFLHADFDIAITSRPRLDKYKDKPLMTGLMWFPVASRDKLIAFYRKALEIGRSLPTGQKRWGADTTPIVELLAPIQSGTYQRSGMTVCVFPWPTLAEAGPVFIRKFRQGKPPREDIAVLDFKYWYKRNMVEIYRRLFE